MAEGEGGNVGGLRDCGVELFGEGATDDAPEEVVFRETSEPNRPPESR